MRKLKDLVLGLALMLAGLSTIVSCSDDDGIWTKVSWQGENVYITELVNEPIGARKELYVRGSSFNTTGNDVDIYKDADAKDYKWNAPGYNGSHDYSLVKIFDKIWMRG